MTLLQYTDRAHDMSCPHEDLTECRIREWPCQRVLCGALELVFAGQNQQSEPPTIPPSCGPYHPVG